VQNLLEALAKSFQFFDGFFEFAIFAVADVKGFKILDLRD
jgi:hypothetical protein